MSPQAIQRVAASYLKTSVLSHLKEKGHFWAADKSWFLEWNSHSLHLVEAPIRTREQRARETDPNRGFNAVRWSWDYVGATPQNTYNVLQNVLPRAGIRPQDSAAEVRAKIARAFTRFISLLQERGVEGLGSRFRLEDDEKVSFLQRWLDGTHPNFPIKVNWSKGFDAPLSFVPKFGY